MFSDGKHVAPGLHVLAANSVLIKTKEVQSKATQGRKGPPQDRRTRMGMALEVQRAELSQQKLCCRRGLSLVGQAAGTNCL